MTAELTKLARRILQSMRNDGLTVTDVMGFTGANYDQCLWAIKEIEQAGMGQWVWMGGKPARKILLPMSVKKPRRKLTERQSRSLGLFISIAEPPLYLVRKTYNDLCELTGYARGSICYLIESLEGLKFIQTNGYDKWDRTFTFQILYDTDGNQLYVPMPMEFVAPPTLVVKPDVPPGPAKKERVTVDAEPFVVATYICKPQPHRNVTRHVLGDPRPGRTPWAAPDD
jgi:hypothetical protein